MPHGSWGQPKAIHHPTHTAWADYDRDSARGTELGSRERSKVSGYRTACTRAVLLMRHWSMLLDHI